MKVVINRQFGGFGVSREVLLRLIKMKSKFVKKENADKYFSWGKYAKKDYNITKKSEFKPFKDGYLKHWFIDDWLVKDGFVFYVDDERINEFRTDKDVIKIVKKLGKKANGDHATLEIVEIPDDVEFEVQEYDGLEHIAEKHRTWT